MKQNYDFDCFMQDVHEKFETLEKDVNKQISKLIHFCTDQYNFDQNIMDLNKN